MNSYSNINTNDTLCQPPRAPTQNETIIFNAIEVINFNGHAPKMNSINFNAIEVINFNWDAPKMNSINFN